MDLIGNIVTWIGILVIVLVIRKSLLSIQAQMIAIQENLLESGIHRIDKLEKKVDDIINNLVLLSESETDRAQNQNDQMKQLQECQNEIKAIYSDAMKKLGNKLRTVNDHCKEMKENGTQIMVNLSLNTKMLEQNNKEHKKGLSNMEELLRLLLVNSLIDDAEEAMEVYCGEKVK